MSKPRTYTTTERTKIRSVCAICSAVKKMSILQFDENKYAEITFFTTVSLAILQVNIYNMADKE